MLGLWAEFALPDGLAEAPWEDSEAASGTAVIVTSAGGPWTADALASESRASFPWGSFAEKW